MSELVIRNMDETVLEQLHQKAAMHGITVEEEVKMILVSAIGAASQKSVLERARAIRKRNAHLQKTNTLDLLREDRDSR